MIGPSTYSSMSYDLTQKIVLMLASSALIAVAVLSATLPAAESYNALLVDDVGNLMTLVRIIILLTGVSLWLSSHTGQRYWSAIFVYFANIGILLTLPLARGYYLPARPTNDILVQLGYARVILETGSTVAGDWYPAAHLLSSIVSMWGLPLRGSWVPIVIVHLGVFVLGLAVLSRQISHTQMTALVTLPGIPLLFGPFLSGLKLALLSLFLLPLTIWLSIRLLKRPQRREVILTFILLLLMVVYHPITAILTLICYTIMAVFEYRWLAGGLSVLSAAGVAYISYLFSFDRFRRVLSGLLIGLLGRTESSGVGGTGAVSMASNIFGQPVGRILRVFINHYGPIFLYFILGSVAVLVFVAKWYLRDGRLFPRAVALFFTGGLTAIIILVYDIYVRSPYRATKLLIVAAIILVALLLITSRQLSKYRIEYALVALILLAAVASVGTVFSTSNHITESNAVGLRWTVEYQDADKTLSAAGVSRELVAFEYGTLQRPDWEVRFGEAPVLSMNVSYVIATPRASKEYFRWSRAEWGKHATVNNTARMKLNMERSRIYSNGGYTIWKKTNPG